MAVYVVGDTEYAYCDGCGARIGLARPCHDTEEPLYCRACVYEPTDEDMDRWRARWGMA